MLNNPSNLTMKPDTMSSQLSILSFVCPSIHLSIHALLPPSANPPDLKEISISCICYDDVHSSIYLPNHRLSICL